MLFSFTFFSLQVNATDIDSVYNKGDVNLDNEINILDATTIQKYCVLLIDFDEIQLKNADMDNNGKINSQDVTYLQRDILNSVKYNSKDTVLGVTFFENCSRGVRIEDAQGLQNNYKTKNGFANKRNDFDYVYPWCNIRLCNLTVDKNNNKKVTYQNEPNFALDGSNGNVMVEIPKFYISRTKCESFETWRITGTPKEDFTLAPIFYGDNGELDYAYVSAYEFSAPADNSSLSKTNQNVRTGLKLVNYRYMAEAENLNCLDYATVASLQYLWAIEFADRNTGKYMQGYSNAPWFSCSNSPIKSISPDKKTVTVDYENTRIKNFKVGHSVILSKDNSTIQNSLKIQNITFNSKTKEATITLDKKLEFNFDSNNYYIAGTAQPTGTCDELGYHTGNISNNDGSSTFRYRYMENLWGNTWSLIEGIKVKKLNYYYTYSPSKYAKSNIKEWEKFSISAPNQPYLGESSNSPAWIKEMSYDDSQPTVLLPSVCGNGATPDYYSSALYTLYDVDKEGIQQDINTEYSCVYGGGYDHNNLCGLFTMRFWWNEEKGEAQSLHSTRVIYRN